MTAARQAGEAGTLIETVRGAGYRLSDAHPPSDG